ncbi:MAG: hypothetical protein C4523_05390 [Myxococcales bacterium]|nr:MAG: hypothetical protein C4523_05390 [Myxococcales bacterium]
MKNQIILIAALVVLASSASAEVPQFITYSGRLTDGTGWGQTLVASFDFSIYDAATDGSLLWTQHFDAVAIEDGYFSIMLGDGEDALGGPLNVTAVFASYGETWITVSADGSEELEPRQPVGSVPYAVGTDTLAGHSLAELKAEIKAELKEELLQCPPYYERVDDATITATGYYCKRGVDEMVKVGDFWIDRYENVIVDETKYNFGGCDGSGGTIYGQDVADPGSVWDSVGFPRNGQATTKLYACSVKNNAPMRNVTWFQAQAACGFSGKVLPTNAQWQLAAQGTPDPDSTQPTPGNEKCNIWADKGSKPSGSLWGPQSGQTIQSGSAAQCKSTFGAYDMIGNVREWVDMWGQAGKINTSFSCGANVQPWPTNYASDGTWNINGEAHHGTDCVSAIPAAAIRGGNWNQGAQAGVFALSLTSAPPYWELSSGFRCARK